MEVWGCGWNKVVWIVKGHRYRYIDSCAPLSIATKKTLHREYHSKILNTCSCVRCCPRKADGQRKRMAGSKTKNEDIYDHGTPSSRRFQMGMLEIKFELDRIL